MDASAIIPLTDPRALEARNVGAKAARLAAMARAGFPVPPGFVVGVQAFQHPDRSRDRTNSRQEPPAPGLPPELTARIARAAADLAAPLTAVRSSGVSEDGQGLSMAGQFDTFLNTPPEQVAEKVDLCWASQFGAAPAAYRRKLAGTQTDGRMGVIVQTQVRARWAGVAFTVDPLTKSADHFVIEWVAGLGDRLVSGQVVPHRIVMRREHPERPKDLPPQLATALEQLWQWAHAAERLFRQPLDLEWAADDQGVHILQARPVTGLVTPDTVVWTNVNMAENFPHPLTPLAWSLVDRFYGAYMRAILRYFGWHDRTLAQSADVVAHLTGLQAGRVYYNLNNWYAVMGFFPCSRWLIRFLNHYIGQKVPFDFTFQTHPAATPRGRHRLRTHLLFWSRMVNLVLRCQQHMDNFEPRFFRQRRKWRRTPYDQLTSTRLLRELKALLNFVDRHWAPPAMADVAVMILPGLLDLLTRTWLRQDPERVAAQLYQGLDLISLQPSVLIWEASQGIAADPELKPLLEKGDYERLEQALPPHLRDLVARFMARFGGRCYHDCMLVAPTFVERRDLFWDLVQSYAASQVEHPMQKIRAHRQIRRAFTRDLLQRLHPMQRWVYHWIVRKAQQAVDLRERGRLLQSLLFGEMRLMVLALGRKLQSRGHLTEKGEIFYLHLEEIRHMIDNGCQSSEPPTDRIAARKKTWKENAAIDPPSFFFLEHDAVARFAPPAEAPSTEAAPGTLAGTAVSGGRLTARARVILDPLQGDRLQSGEILVTRATDPGWTPLFSIAGGLILERGGLLSHGAIVAREFGIPAVAGVDNATRLIQDGMRVELDGHAGRVNLRPTEKGN